MEPALSNFVKKSVLVVDDAPDNLILLCELLKDHYQVKVANSGETALKIAHSSTPPDIILLDIMMPRMDGYEVCRQLKRDSYTTHIPIMFLTARSDPESEAYGFDLGVADYITKPISPPIVLARIKAQLQIKAAADFLDDKARYLEHEVVKRSQETATIQGLTILAMAFLAESSVYETSNHLRRTQHYVKALAQKLRFNPRFVNYLSDSNINILFWAAPLHDIGNLGIPDHILLKPGATRLTPEEFEIVKTHTTLGWQAVQRADQSLEIRGEFLTIAKDMILYHHERMDGSGYPQGLKGDQIPISARLMAIADVYDALVSERAYKAVVPHERAVEILCKEQRHNFDPDMLDALVAIEDEFESIALRFIDNKRPL